MALEDRIVRICRQDLDERALRIALLDAIRTAVPFDFYAWLLTDPETTVGSAPLAETPSLADLPRLIRLKYLTATNRWTTLAPNSPSTLLETTGGDPAASRLWRELLSEYGIDDVVSMVLRDQLGCWAFLDLWRWDGPFTKQECDVLQSVAGAMTDALRRSVAAAFAPSSSTPRQHTGPAVLLLSESLGLVTQTPQADAYLRALLPTEAGRSPVPAAAYNVAAQLFANEEGVDDHPPSARVHLGGGSWVSLRAARIEQRPQSNTASIAVSIEATPPAERAVLYSLVLALTEREAELLGNLVGGCDTREIAGRMFLSEHTVQDHLKSIFAKAGVNSRRQLIARATGVA